jgi:hypothetical protein
VIQFSHTFVVGFLFCRFHIGTEETKALGRYLVKCFKGNFEPYFVIEDSQSWDTIQKLPITEEIVKDMVLKGRFIMDRVQIVVVKQLAEISISLCLQDDGYPFASNSHLPISGFPRPLMIEDIPQRKSF